MLSNLLWLFTSLYLICCLFFFPQTEDGADRSGQPSIGQCAAPHPLQGMNRITLHIAKLVVLSCVPIGNGAVSILASCAPPFQFCFNSPFFFFLRVSLFSSWPLLTCFDVLFIYPPGGQIGACAAPVGPIGFSEWTARASGSDDHSQVLAVLKLDLFIMLKLKFYCFKVRQKWIFWEPFNFSHFYLSCKTFYLVRTHFFCMLFFAGITRRQFSCTTKQSWCSRATSMCSASRKSRCASDLLYLLFVLLFVLLVACCWCVFCRSNEDCIKHFCCVTSLIRFNACIITGTNGADDEGPDRQSDRHVGRHQLGGRQGAWLVGVFFLLILSTAGCIRYSRRNMRLLTCSVIFCLFHLFYCVMITLHNNIHSFFAADTVRQCAAPDECTHPTGLQQAPGRPQTALVKNDQPVQSESQQQQGSQQLSGRRER